MKVKLQGYGSTEVYFKILNLLNGETYQTSSHKVWFRDTYRDYIKSLNNNILTHFEP